MQTAAASGGTGAASIHNIVSFGYLGYPRHVHLPSAIGQAPATASAFSAIGTHILLSHNCGVEDKDCLYNQFGELLCPSPTCCAEHLRGASGSGASRRHRT